MDLMEAIEKRHSIRSYTTDKIEDNISRELEDFINKCNEESGLHMQLCLEEPKAFSTFMAHYGSFKNVNNYIAIVGKKSKDFEEKCGYYGEKVILKATQLGLSTCWVALTYSKGKTVYEVEKDEKLWCVISLGYGAVEGIPHKNKPMETLCTVNGEMPQWFERGMKAAMMAPTAVNQQKFHFTLEDNIVSAKAGLGFYAKMDLGIVKYHFEIGARDGDWKWKD